MTEELEQRIDAMLDALDAVLDYPLELGQLVSLIAQKVDEHELLVMKGEAA